MNRIGKRIISICTGMMLLAAGSPVQVLAAGSGQPASGAVSAEIVLAANLYTTGTGGKADHAALQWDTTLDAASYTLYRSEGSDSDFVPVYSGTGKSWSDNNMQTGKVYYYQLAVTGKNGTS